MTQKENALQNEFLQAFHAGEQVEAERFFGAHPGCCNGQKGVFFRTLAPGAERVAVVGDFNDWNPQVHICHPIDDKGIYECFVPGVAHNDYYKFAVTAKGKTFLKADPYATRCEAPPGTASRYYPLEEIDFPWEDETWFARPGACDPYGQPMNIYELHLGSWKQGEKSESLSYREIAEELIQYLHAMHYTHVELLPIMEHPFDGSWGYQITGYFAPTARYGTPRDFMAFVNALHTAGIGVILDWVPGHFPRDGHGLFEFDGGPCYEYADPKKGEHKEWGTRVFDYGKPQVQSFLISNAVYWFRQYHIDGLRVDAVASMLYLDYGRPPGQWLQNRYGGRENLEAIEFLKRLNEAVFARFPYALMIAEESTAFPMVTKPTAIGGLGFNFKWNMGWMNDMLRFMSEKSEHRRYHHGALTFSFYYAFSENYILPLSHDEVVHGKCSLISKIPGSYEEKFKSLRAFYGYMMAHPGKKMLFMGQEFGQFIEWNHTRQLDWLLLAYDSHKTLQRYVADLNQFYLQNPCLWQQDCSWEGFSWIMNDDTWGSSIAFCRYGKGKDSLICLCRFAASSVGEYRVGVPCSGVYRMVFSSDDCRYGGDSKGGTDYISQPIPAHGFRQSVCLPLPGLTALFLRCVRPAKTASPGLLRKTVKKPKQSADKIVRKAEDNVS